MRSKTKRQPCYPGLAHFFVIEEANGHTSPGVCKYCGLEGIFQNSTPQGPWGKFQINPP